MKLQLLSDAHLEFHRDDGESFLNSILQEADVLVIAGDLGLCRQLYPTFDFLSPLYPHIIYVTGNHEYYHSSLPVVHKRLEDCQKEFKNLHWLNNSSIEIEGQKFIGGTGWFPDQPDNFKYEHMLNDFGVIQDFTNWVYKEHNKFLKLLEDNLAKGDIIVMHHLPTIRSVSDIFRSSALNRFFICDIVDRIINREPSYVLHGHTHTSCSYTYDTTKIYCNPFGYVAQVENLEFNDNLILEV